MKEDDDSLLREVTLILYRHDPIGIAFPDISNENEYEPEAGTIIPRLHEASSSDEARRIIHAEFVRWFDRTTAGQEARYTAIARDVWAAWRRWSPE